MTVRPIASGAAPRPAGHYAQGAVAGGMLFVSGQLPVTPEGVILRDASFPEQARQAIANLLAIVAAAGGTPADLARVTAYIVGVGHWAAFNQVYAELMGTAKPARTVVPVPELHHGVLVEIDAIAWLGDPAPADASRNPR